MATNGNDHNDRPTVLVVVQLGGGNDFMNTVVPYAESAVLRLSHVGERSGRRGDSHRRPLRLSSGDGACEGDVGRGEHGDRRGRGLSQSEPLALPLDGHLAHVRAGQGGRPRDGSAGRYGTWTRERERSDGNKLRERTAESAGHPRGSGDFGGADRELRDC